MVGIPCVLTQCGQASVSVGSSSTFSTTGFFATQLSIDANASVFVVRNCDKIFSQRLQGSAREHFLVVRDGAGDNVCADHGGAARAVGGTVVAKLLPEDPEAVMRSRTRAQRAHLLTFGVPAR